MSECDTGMDTGNRCFVYEVVEESLDPLAVLGLSAVRLDCGPRIDVSATGSVAGVALNRGKLIRPMVLEPA